MYKGPLIGEEAKMKMLDSAEDRRSKLTGICPFCKKTPKIDNRGVFKAVYCDNHHFFVRTRYTDNYDKMIKRWNKNQLCLFFKDDCLYAGG